MLGDRSNRIKLLKCYHVGLPDYCIAHSALPKLRNLLSTRVILHTKMNDIDYSNV